MSQRNWMSTIVALGTVKSVVTRLYYASATFHGDG